MTAVPLITLAPAIEVFGSADCGGGRVNLVNSQATLPISYVAAALSLRANQRGLDNSAVQLSTTVNGSTFVSSRLVTKRNLWPSPVTLKYEGNTRMLRRSKSALGTPASNVAPVLTSTAIIFQSGAM